MDWEADTLRWEADFYNELETDYKPSIGSTMDEAILKAYESSPVAQIISCDMADEKGDYTSAVVYTKPTTGIYEIKGEIYSNQIDTTKTNIKNHWDSVLNKYWNEFWKAEMDRVVFGTGVVEETEDGFKHIPFLKIPNGYIAFDPRVGYRTLEEQKEIENKPKTSDLAKCIDSFEELKQAWIENRTVPVIGKNKTCQHSWKPYTGFTESYEFCEHCDEKRK